MLDGNCGTAKFVGGPKPPAPSPSRTETLCEMLFGTARSLMPSPSKSPEATEAGPAPTPYVCGSEKTGVVQSAAARAVEGVMSRRAASANAERNKRGPVRGEVPTWGITQS